MNCPLCNAPDSAITYEGSRIDDHRCGSCRHRWQADKDGTPCGDPPSDALVALRRADGREIWAGLGEVDRERLGDLIVGYDQAASCGWQPRQDGQGVWDGVAPIDCGGTNGSDHSYRLTKLVRLGLAQHRKGAAWGRASTRHKGAKKYRPTPLGRAVYEARREMS